MTAARPPANLVAWLREHRFVFAGERLDRIAVVASEDLGQRIVASDIVAAAVPIAAQEVRDEHDRIVQAGRKARCGRRGSLRWREDQPSVDELHDEIAGDNEYPHKRNKL